MLKKNVTRVAAVLLTVGVLTGCATPGGDKARLEAETMAKSNARWKALIEGDVKLAYELTAPSYRAIVPFQSFRRRFGTGPWITAEAINADCQLEKCNIRVRMTYQAPMIQLDGGKMTTSVVDTWIKEDGQWWYLPRP